MKRVGTETTKAANATKKARNVAGDASDVIFRDVFPRFASENGKYCKVISWNVNGLRALVKNKFSTMEKLIETEKPDILCLQETKLQEQNVPEFENMLKGYKSHFSSSTARKGYAGTAVFVSKSTIPKYDIEFGIGFKEHDNEGRSITVKLPYANIVNLYVPNSGQKLERLAYRTDKWDIDLREYLKTLSEKTSNPSLICGDLNVAHGDLDIYNFDAKHIQKQAGCTPQERKSFTEFLESGYVDTFRHLYPEARGAFTYWSGRANNRPWNKGLRLDYFCAPKDAAEMVVDSFILPDATVGVSDHCPVGMLMKYE